MSYIEIRDRAGLRRIPTGQYCTFGRSANNDVILYGAIVSRSHARLVTQNGKAILEDVGSTHGTFVNGQPLQGWYVLRDGDQVQMGDAWVVYRTSEQGYLASSPTPPQGVVSIPVQQQALPQVSTPLPPSPPDPKMTRCPHCGTLNLKSNSLCYRCGNALWQPGQRQERDHEHRGRATAPSAHPVTQVESGTPRWLVVFLVLMLAMVLCLLGLLVGMLLAGTPLGRWGPAAAMPLC